MDKSEQRLQGADGCRAAGLQGADGCGTLGGSSEEARSKELSVCGYRAMWLPLYVATAPRGARPRV